MDKIEEIRAKIGECDDIIIKQLAVRMSHIQEIISYKKATGIPILQPEQEKKQTDALAEKLGDNEFPAKRAFRCGRKVKFAQKVWHV